MICTRKKIILVDDNITNLHLGRNALSSDYDVVTIPSGDKLFKALEKISPDLILLDVEMPDMDGFEIIKVLKGNKETADIPIIFLTAKEDLKTREEGLLLGAKGYITKPFFPAELLKCIEANLYD